MTPPRFVFLFDIDLTLVHTYGSGGRALNETFRALLGIEDAFVGYDFQGKVDSAIFAESYRRHLGAEPPPAMVTRVREDYARRLGENLAGPNSYRILPGVVPLLEHLAARSDVRLGLATGNIEEGARLKLEPGDLNRFFETGGFGSDAATREELTAIGIERVLAGAPRPPRDRVFVVGDTEKDVAAAHANDATAIAVATGGPTRERLAAANPDLLLDDLSDWPTWLPPLLSR